MLILEIVGWILLAVLGLFVLILSLLFLALLAPVRLRLSYDRAQGFCAGLRYLWFDKQLAPAPQNKRTARPQQRPAARPKKKEAYEKQQDGKRTAAENAQPPPQAQPTPSAERVPPPPALRATEKALENREPFFEKSPDNREAAKAVAEEKTENEAYPPAGAAQEPQAPQAEKMAADTAALESAEKDKEAAGGVAPAQQEQEDRLFAFSLDKLGVLVKTAGGLIKRILQSLRYQDICLTLPVKGRDAADCAVKFGKVNAALSGFFTLCGMSRLRYTFADVKVFPDFNGDDTGGIRFAVTLRGKALWVLTAALWAVRRLMKEKLLFPDGLPFFKKRNN